jgi:hypothetical protein
MVRRTHVLTCGSLVCHVDKYTPASKTGDHRKKHMMSLVTVKPYFKCTMTRLNPDDKFMDC